MKSDIDLICEVLTELYENAEPKGDFKNLYMSPIKSKFWEYHHLDMNKQSAIFEKVMKRNKIYGLKKRAVSEFVFLACSPCSCNYTNPKHKRVDNK